MFRTLKLLAGSTAIVIGLALVPVETTPAMAEDLRVDQDVTLVKYRSEVIEGVKIAYREAGDPSNPAVLLLHDFPTSSNMFRDLIPRIATRWQVIAPDCPGFGASDMPPADAFEYSFAHLARIVAKLIDRKGVNRYAAYVMDYGAPVGFRMFAAHPERVTAFVIQNGNAYEEGLREFWNPLRAYWADPSKETGDKLRPFLTLEGTMWQYRTGMQNPDRVNPDNYWHVQYLLDRPGSQEVQLELFLNYGINVAEYPKWQALFREFQSPALLMWGKKDRIFSEEGRTPTSRISRTSSSTCSTRATSRSMSTGQT